MNQNTPQQTSFLLKGALWALLSTLVWAAWASCQYKQVRQEPTKERSAEPAKREAPPEKRNPETRAEARPTEARPTEVRPGERKPPERTPDKTTLTGTWAKDAPIDIHAHIGSYSGYDLSTPTLLSNLKKYGIRWALISNIDGANLSATKNISEDKANQATIDTVRQHADRLRGIYWTRPNKGISSQADKMLQSTLSANDPQRIFVAMKFHPDMNQFPADSAKLDPYMKLCQKHKLVAVFHSGSAGTNSDPAKIYALGKRYPDVPIVMYHMGFFGPHGGAITAAENARKNKDALVYLGTAQADPAAVLQAVKTLKSTAIMFGTDAAYFAPDHYARYTSLVQRLRAGLSTDDFANLMRNNARKLFQLP